MQRVCITGIGMVTPLGCTALESWRAMLAGTNAAGKISLFDATGWPVDIACEVKGFEACEQAISGLNKDLINRPTAFGLQSAFEALSDAAINPDDIEPQRFGTCIGTGIGAIKPADVLFVMKDYVVERGFDFILHYLEKNWRDPLLLERNHPGQLAALLARKYNTQAFQLSMTTACAAGAQAIGHGFRMLRQGRSDVVIAGGSDSIAGELLHAGFCMLGVLSKRTDEPFLASRPFDRHRDGFVASEGGAVLCMETLAHAKKRGAKIYAEIIGYGESENAYRITDLPSDGRGAIKAMQDALSDAKISPPQVQLVNAHGTSTEQNDRVEALAVEKVFYDNHAKPMVTANKSQIGHFVAAAGAVEAAISALSLKDQKVPYILNLSDSDCSDRIDFVREAPRADPNLDIAISNSFGFGGTNACIVFKRWDE